MSEPLQHRFAAGLRTLSQWELAWYLAVGSSANLLFVAGVPKVGMALSAMALGNYIAAVFGGESA